MPRILSIAVEEAFLSQKDNRALLSALVSRAAVHESRSVDDALAYLESSWPTVVLITNICTTADELQLGNEGLRSAVLEFTKNGGTTILMGSFFAAFESNDTFEYFNVKWESAVFAIDKLVLRRVPCRHEMPLIRTQSLVKAFRANAWFLDNVPYEQIVCVADIDDPTPRLVYVVVSRVDKGMLECICDDKYGKKATKVVLAMCRLDQEENNCQPGRSKNAHEKT